MNNSRLPLVIILALGVVAVTIWQKSGSASALDYRPSWGDALEEARDSSQPILLIFGGPW